MVYWFERDSNAVDAEMANLDAQLDKASPDKGALPDLDSPKPKTTNEQPNSVVKTGPNPSPADTQTNRTVTDRGQLSTNGVSRLKKATAFVIATKNGSGSTGSSFVVHRGAGFAILATNAHVIEGFTDVDVVFHSGTNEERKLTGSVIAELEEIDLALLKVTGQNLPSAIPFAKTNIEPGETSRVYVAGYPFGQQLSLESQNPTATISQGTVSSLRRDRNGHLSMIQIDGALNPGNSGGPIVSSTGEIVGVSTATLLGAQIGMAVPAQTLRPLVLGRPLSLSVEQTNRKSGKTTVKFTLRLLNPLNKISNASVAYLRANRDKPDFEFGADGARIFPSTASICRLTINGTTATGSIELSGKDGTLSDVHLQSRVTRTDGSTFGVDAEPARIAFGAGRLIASGTQPNEDWIAGGKKSGNAAREIVLPKQDLSPRFYRGKGSPFRSGRIYIPKTDKQVERYAHAGLSKQFNTSFVLARDRRSFFHLQRNGVLHQISWPAMRIMKSLDLGSFCANMHVSAAGLVISRLMQNQRLADGFIVVDQQSLKVKSVWGVDTFKDFATCSRNSLAVIVKSSLNSPDSLSVVDLSTGVVVDTQANSDLKVNFESLDRKILTVQMSPDGEHVIATDKTKPLRLSFLGKRLRPEQFGKPVKEWAARCQFSSDSKYVVLPGTKGASVFRPSDLSEPLISFPAQERGNACAFDSENTSVYVSADGRLTIHNLKTKSKQSIKGTDFCTQILVNPKDRSFLVLHGSTLMFHKYEPE